MADSVVLRYQCPRCQAQNQATEVAAGSELNCGRCDWSRTVTGNDLNDNRPRRCLVCATEDLWRQKNFPQAVGIAFVGIGAIGSSIAWYYHRPVLALGVLLAVAAIDFALFAIMPDVLVCYRCGARHSGDIAEHPVFDHETAERYRQERLRLEQDPESSGASPSHPS